MQIGKEVCEEAEGEFDRQIVVDAFLNEINSISK